MKRKMQEYKDIRHLLNEGGWCLITLIGQLVLNTKFILAHSYLY